MSHRPRASALPRRVLTLAQLHANANHARVKLIPALQSALTLAASFRVESSRYPVRTDAMNEVIEREVSAFLR